MEFPSPYTLLVTFFVSFPFLLLVFNAIKKHRNVKNLPPGPRKLPLIGNLHQLVGNKLPHEILRDLAKKYGPMIHLHFGETPVVVVSSSKMAKEFLKTQDHIFASRPEILAFKIIFYDRQDIALHPLDDYWRQMRKICVMELLSVKKVKSFGSIRREAGQLFVESVRNSIGKSMNLSEKIMIYTSTVVCRAAFGRDCKDQESFVKLIQDASVVASGFDIADMFPSYKFVHFLSGQTNKLRKIHSKIDAILEDVINHHVNKNSASDQNNGNGEVVEEDIIHTFLRIMETSSLNFPITTQNIKGVLLDIFSGGNETSSVTAIWAMAEMMRNPEIMEKAQKEIREAFKGKETIDEAEFQGLDYLNSIIKETLRLHPPFPLNLPRESLEDSVVNGYDIPMKTKVIINAWAIGRDPEYWYDPYTFYPERHLNTSNGVDFSGNNFNFLPFGSGRRTCPGIAFALPNIHVPLTHLLYNFDWNLPKGMKPQDMNMDEAFGTTCPMKNDLYLIPTLHPHPH